MASREEQKRLRREERERAEAAAAASQGRARRLQFLVAALVTIAAVVVVVLLGTGGGDDGDGGGPADPAADTATATIPEPAERDLDASVAAADCVLRHPPIPSSGHVEGDVDYKSNPPTSGDHSPTPALDGIYERGQEPAPENSVHSLEHGRINIMYAPDSPPTLVGQLETLASEPLNGKAGYKTLLFQNNTDMPYQVAASAWGHFIGCEEASPEMFDALRNFRVRYVDKGPEPGIPPTN